MVKIGWKMLFKMWNTGNSAAAYVHKVLLFSATNEQALTKGQISSNTMYMDWTDNNSTYTVSQKNWATFIFTVTLANVDRFQ